MPFDAILYSKQSGETAVPLTVRIEWLQDGTIKPLMYWTPDGTCFRIVSQRECVPIAFLRERGEGLRYRVQSEIIETTDPCFEYLHTRYETYLYLADKRFCEKNIIDERYSHAGKEYIPVIMDVFSDGDYELIYFWVHGLRYMVERVIIRELHGSFKAGGVGIRHKVEARLVNADDDDDPDPNNCVCRPAALYLEFNKWFIHVSTHV